MLGIGLRAEDEEKPSGFGRPSGMRNAMSRTWRDFVAKRYYDTVDLSGSVGFVKERSSLLTDPKLGALWETACMNNKRKAEKKELFMEILGEIDAKHETVF